MKVQELIDSLQKLIDNHPHREVGDMEVVCEESLDDFYIPRSSDIVEVSLETDTAHRRWKRSDHVLIIYVGQGSDEDD